jgi:hypothetical protein
MMINQLTDDKKWIDFVKIKFHSTENIECHCMQLELNWIQNSKFLNRNPIQLKGNKIQIAAKKN